MAKLTLEDIKGQTNKIYWDRAFENARYADVKREELYVLLDALQDALQDLQKVTDLYEDNWPEEKPNTLPLAWKNVQLWIEEKFLDIEMKHRQNVYVSHNKDPLEVEADSKKYFAENTALVNKLKVEAIERLLKIEDINDIPKSRHLWIYESPKENPAVKESWTAECKEGDRVLARGQEDPDDDGFYVYEKGKWKKEKKKEPVTDCLEDGWIKHEGTTGKCPVEEGTLLLVKSKDGSQHYRIARQMEFLLEAWCINKTLMAYKIIAPASEKWIAWNGGECPVSGQLNIEIMFRDGDTAEPIIEDEPLEWDHEGEDSDIIAYRVIEEKEEEKPSFKRIDDRHFSYGERKFKVKGNAINPCSICLVEGGEIIVLQRRFKTLVLAGHDFEIYNDWFIEVTEEKFSFRIINKNHFGYGWRIFKLTPNTKMALLDFDPTDSNINNINNLLLLSKTDSTDSIKLYSPDDTGFDKSKYFAEATENSQYITATGDVERWSKIAERLSKKAKYERVKAKFRKIYSDFCVEYSLYSNKKGAHTRYTIEKLDMLQTMLEYLVEELFGETNENCKYFSDRKCECDGNCDYM